ncbi:hypothetical protein SEA_DATBOI_121 [Gordonia phage DatBoi]|nr:hypothetical protein SEA_DATBOI_121 [Gordonia phage DatBoi]
MSTDVLERPEVADADTDDREKEVHYIKKTDVLESTVNGKIVRALCGATFLVTRLAKSGSPVCEKCKTIHAQLRP